ncbi:MAG: hypothetical protein EZS28_007413 [Streblomastix strix]|uniref:Uncharacterized protein n=1 Tax=Streblomastix strix TaxID=222440 RepID=A0A5J4WSI1_9EUKA|nr:MAG: hypothetical protein EZS28_007413 [Streblomastix strix]
MGRSFADTNRIATKKLTRDEYYATERRIFIKDFRKKQDLRGEVRISLPKCIPEEIRKKLSVKNIKFTSVEENPEIARFHKLQLTDEGKELVKLIFDKTIEHDEQQLQKMKERRNIEIEIRKKKRKRADIESEDDYSPDEDQITENPQQIKYRALVGQILKQIITILSPVISHTGSFTFKCVAQMFKNDFFSDIEKCYWFSDGSPNFRNQQLVCALLRDTQPLIPNVKFQINYSEPAHGKDEIDALFGNYQTELNENLSDEGISSLIALQESLSQMSFINSLQNEDPLCWHDVIIYDIPCVENKIDIIRIPGFKQYLSFRREENSIVTSHLSNEENAEDTKIKIVIIQKDSTKALKRSTVQIEEDDD